MAHGSGQKHLPVRTWLSAVSLPQYEPLFVRYKGVEELVEFGEAELRAAGVKNNAHRAHLASSLVVLRAKLQAARPHPTGDTNSNPHHTADQAARPHPTGDTTSNPQHTADPATNLHPTGNTTSNPQHTAELATRPYPTGDTTSNPQHTADQATRTHPTGDITSTPQYTAVTDKYPHHLTDDTVGVSSSSRHPSGNTISVPVGVGSETRSEGERQEPVQQQYEPLHTDTRPWQPASASPVEDSQLHNTSALHKQLWYHGSLPRLKAEALLKQDGDFLVRDSTSMRGDYVLTCQWQGGPKHFKVNRQSVTERHSGAIRTLYQFEETLCDSVTELVNLYMREGRLVSEASGARISFPVKRRISADSLNVSSPRFHSSFCENVSNGHESGSRITHSKRAGSQPLLDIDYSAVDSQPSDTIRKPFLNPDEKPRSSSDLKTGAMQKSLSTQAQHVRSGSEPVLLTGAKLTRGVNSHSHYKLNTESVIETDTQFQVKDAAKQPPPKPSRIPTVKLAKNAPRPKIEIRNKKLYEDDGKDYSDYDQVKSWSGADHKEGQPVLDNVALPGHVRSSDASTASYDSGYHADNTFPDSRPTRQADYDTVAEPITPRPPLVVQPDMNPPSRFDLSDFASQLLTPKNKPLESSAMGAIKSLLLDTDPKVLAVHLTLLDLDLLKVFAMNDLGAGVYSGLELITLPQGAQMRTDALERFHCLRLFVAVSVLSCGVYQQRARMLSAWIRVAMEMRGALGNLYGFAYVMHGLQCPQISRLSNSWISVKQQNESAFQSFRTKLPSFYKSLRLASTALPLHNVTIPYILPLLDMLNDPPSAYEYVWQEPDNPLELDVMLAHLDIVRIITDQSALYKNTSIRSIGSVRPIRDMLELCDTRMHLRLLWGYRGFAVPPAERYDKFEQVLRALSLKCEAPSASTDKESSC